MFSTCCFTQRDKRAKQKYISYNKIHSEETLQEAQCYPTLNTHAFGWSLCFRVVPGHAACSKPRKFNKGNGMPCHDYVTSVCDLSSKETFCLVCYSRVLPPQKLNLANNHVILEVDPSPVQPWDETSAPVNTLTVASGDSEVERPATPCPDSWHTEMMMLTTVWCFKPLRLLLYSHIATHNQHNTLKDKKDKEKIIETKHEDWSRSGQYPMSELRYWQMALATVA